MPVLPLAIGKSEVNPDLFQVLYRVWYRTIKLKRINLSHPLHYTVTIDVLFRNVSAKEFYAKEKARMKKNAKLQAEAAAAGEELKARAKSKTN